jgi:lipid-binding SYLF domain-containing protein
MKEIGKKIRKIPYRLIFCFFAAAIITVFASPVWATEKDKAQAVVDKACGALIDFMSDPDFSWLQHHIATARGMLIFPQVVRGGFFVGGSGGTGVLLVRKPMTDEWSEPAFYTIGSASLGTQIGAGAAEVVVLAMSKKAIDSLFSSSFKLGENASIAIGPKGGGVTGEVTADFVSFARSKGLYAGINLEGSVIEMSESLNEDYYGMALSPEEIIAGKAVSSPGSKALRDTLKKAASMKKFR